MSYHLPLSCALIICPYHVPLSFDLIIWLYHWLYHLTFSFDLIIWRYPLTLPLDPTIWPYHLTLSFDLIIWPISSIRIILLPVLRCWKYVLKVYLYNCRSEIYLMCLGYYSLWNINNILVLMTILTGIICIYYKKIRWTFFL